MKKLIISLVCLAISLAACARPRCQSFNNYNDKVTIVFTDEEAGKAYSVSDAKLVTLGKEYAATSLKTNMNNGVVTVTLTFPHITKFSNPKVTLRINGKKTKFKVCQ